MDRQEVQLLLFLKLVFYIYICIYKIIMLHIYFSKYVCPHLEILHPAAPAKDYFAIRLNHVKLLILDNF